MSNFGRVYYEEQFCEIILNFGQWFGSRWCLKYFLSGALVAPFLMEQNHLCNFERGHHGEHSCEVIWNLDQWIRRQCLLKAFLIYSSGSPFVQWTGTICEILEEDIMRNNPVELFWIRTSGSGGNAVWRYWELWQPFCSEVRNHLCNFGRRHHEEQFCVIILNLDQWVKRRCV